MDTAETKWLEYRLYAKDVPFSKRFISDDILKELLVDRFSKHIPEEYKRFDAGTIYGKKACGFLDICKKYGKEPANAFFVYEEKKRAKFLIVTNDGKIITDSAETRLLEHTEAINGQVDNLAIDLELNVSKSLQDLLRNYLYLIGISLDNSKLSHPIEKTTITKCEQFVKMCVVQSIKYGFSAMQIERILQYMKCFGLSTNHLKIFISQVMDDKLEWYDTYMKQLLGESKSDYVLLTDLIYMVYLGQYNASVENEMLNSICKIFEISYSTVDSIYSKVKEIR